MFKKITTAVLCVVTASCAWEDPTVPPKTYPVATSPSANIGIATSNVKKSQEHTFVIRDIATKAEQTGLPPDSNEAREIKTRAALVEGLLTQTRVDLGKAEAQSNDLEKERNQYLNQWQSTGKLLSTTQARLSESVGKIKEIAKQRNILAVVLSLIILGAVAWVIFRLYTARRLF